MQLESIKNILNQDSSDFDRELREQLEEALRNHPKVVRAKRLNEIYSRITELNSEISDLLREAQSLDENNTIFKTVEETTPIKDYENVDDVEIKDDQFTSQTKFLDKDFKDNVFKSITDVNTKVEETDTEKAPKGDVNG